MLVLEAEFVVLVLDCQQLVSFDDAALLDQSNRTVIFDLFLLGNDLSSLVKRNSERNTLGRREYDVVGEALWIRYEHIFFGLSLEIVEHVLVKDAQFLVVRALYKLFRVLPGDWAEILELRHARFENASVHVEVTDLARPMAS